MSHLYEFIGNHLALCTIFVVILIAVLVNEWQQLKQAGHALEPYLIVNKMNREKASVIDIRPPAQFSQGHIINAINQQSAKADDLKKYKDQEVVIVCADGSQSLALSLQLKAAGFSKVHTLKGGMTAWTTAELPTTTS